MSNDIAVKNKFGIVIGWRRDIGDTIQAISIKSGFVGRYVKSSDITFDKTGRIFAYGDATDSLIRQES